VANIAEGILEIRHITAEAASDLETRVHGTGNLLNYACQADHSFEGNTLTILFTCRWTCSDAWKFFENLLSDESYEYRPELLRSEMKGKGTEPGSFYKEVVKKACNSKTFEIKR